MFKETLKRKSLFTIIIPVLLFGFFAVCYPVGISNDSQQYVAMHIHRDPLYCFFLWLLRLPFDSESESYMQIAKWLQNILAALSVIFLTNSISRTYLKSDTSKDASGKAIGNRINYIMEILVCLLCVSPHIITPFVAQTKLILSNSIMSESITLPLFYFFIGSMVLMMESDRLWDKHSFGALIFAWLLSIARGQMMVMLIVFVIVKIAECIRRYVKEKKIMFKHIFFAIIAFVLSFAVRILCVNTYNLVFNNYFMGTAYSDVSLLANVMYATDSDAEELIEDEKAHRFFLASMTKIQESEFSYHYSDSGILARGRHLEDNHDNIKFEAIEECWRAIHYAEDEVLSEDYELEAKEQDRVASIILKDIFPSCIGRWIYDYIALCIYGFVRTVAVMNTPFLIYAVIIYIFILGYIITSLIKKKNRANNSLLRLALFAMLTVCANVCGTAMVIMCLSRYMIYCLPLVYILLLLIIRSFIKK